MREVFIAGIGQTPVTRGQNKRPERLGADAVRAAIADADLPAGDIDALFVGNMTSGILSNQTQLAALIAEQSGLSGLEAMTIEAACASGSAALRTGFMSVAGGMHDAVIICGTEQLAHADKSDATRALATAADYELESSRDETFVSLNATLMRLYLERYRLESDQLAGFAITAHENALTNPNAVFHKRISKADYCAARTVVEPLRLYDVSPICDGAAAVVLASGDVARQLVGQGAAIQVVASSVATMPLALTNRNDPLDLTAVREGTVAAFEQAGITPGHIDLYEPHDAYTIMTALSLEASGYAAPGRGWELSDPVRTGLRSDLPITTFGGLKARGHPVGATGVYQVAEAVMQLRGEAGKNQVADAEFALTQNVGGTASTVVNHILQRVS